MYRTSFILGVIAGMLLWVGWPKLATYGASPPNIVLVLMDDMGWRDVGFMDNSFVETPNLDRLAKKGLVFSQAYASAPNCAPTRACLMSGQYTPRHGIYTVVDPRQPVGSPWHKMISATSQDTLDTAVVTVAESLKAGGYATAFFGMWNLGRGRTGPVTPGGQGFETVVFPENLGFGKDEYFDDKRNYLSDRLTDEVIRFIEANSRSPFFAYYADHAVHAPFNPKPDLLKKYDAKARSSSDRRNDPAYAATIEAVDQTIGRIIATLDRLHLTDKTTVIFTSDNGGTQQYTPPLAGGKGELYEGGLRVPLVIAGSEVKKPGTICQVPVASIDFYPTLLDLAKLPPPAAQILDGESLLPLLRGQAEFSRTRLYWHFPCYVGKATPSSAMREGDFKLIEFFEEGGRRELYDLRNDPYEERDLSATMPDKLKSMYRSLQAWQKETGAAVPRAANPAYQPGAERPRGGPTNGAKPGEGKKKGGGNQGKKGGKNPAR
jgi:arylsulfatase A-like enzyme